MGWQIIAEGRRHIGEDDEIEEMLEDAYRKGCEDGKRKAAREMRGGYGERDDINRDGRDYDDRDGDYDRDNMYDGYGERRGVKGTGRYAGEYRRRYGRR